MSSPTTQMTWSGRLLVILVSVLAHAALFAWLLSGRLSQPLVLEEPMMVAVELVQMPPEPEPVPEPEPEPIPEPEQITEPEPEPEPEIVPEPTPAPAPPPRPTPPAPPAAPKSSGPPVHSFGANTQFAAPPAPPADAPTRAMMAPSGYADTVKNQVIAQIKRPDGAVYKPPPGYRGDPNDFKRQCYIPYQITVDAQGRMLSYEIDRCGDELLDAAAEQAIRQAGPFPAPPAGGAAQYTIYGTAIFIK